MKELKQNYEAMEPSKKRMFLEKKSKGYYKYNWIRKKGAKQYKTMGSAKKQDLLSKQVEKYRTMNPVKKE